MTKSYEIKYLLTLVDDDPTNWVVRKEAALKLYEAGEYLDAANMVWQTPEIPSTDMDVAFAVKMISRAKPNRSIRMVYELWKHNAGKAEQNIAMANVFNLIGFPMLATRCYGAAMALNDKYFDIGFESEAFLTDDSKALSTAWGRARDEDLKQSFAEPCKELRGYPIRFSDLNEELDETSFKNASEAAVEGDVADLGVAFKKFNTIAAEPKKFATPKVAANNAIAEPMPHEAQTPVALKTTEKPKVKQAESSCAESEKKTHVSSDEKLEKSQDADEVGSKPKLEKPKLLVSPVLNKRPALAKDSDKKSDDLPSAPKFLFTQPSSVKDES